MGTTLFDRIGGDAGVAKLIDRFYDKVVADPELGPFFANVSVEKIRMMQREFFRAALDGPQTYTGRPVNHVHARLNIGGSQFSTYVHHLLDTLTEIGTPYEDIRDVVDRIAVYAPEITGESTIPD